MTLHSSAPFPVIEFDALNEWEWPAPPFVLHCAPIVAGVLQPCRIESRSGACVEMQLVRFDAAGARLVLRPHGEGTEVSVPFSRFRRLTLTTPVAPLKQLADAPAEQMPTPAKVRSYKIELTGSSGLLTGRSAGHVERAEGLYLFSPNQDETSVDRVFVPRSAYSGVEFGRTTPQAAAEQWIATPGELLAAIERQARMPLLPIGQSLLALGLLTSAQLDRALSRQSDDRPLGETLVEEGVISRSELQTALAHKMGYPLVDLARFPIDPQAVRRVTPRMAHWARAVPLMLDDKRLIVAVDKPERVSRLRSLHALAHLSVIAALAPKASIVLAISAMPTKDVWFQTAKPHGEFFATTA